MNEKIEYFRAINLKGSEIKFLENATFLLPLKYMQIGVSFFNYSYCGLTVYYLVKNYLNVGNKNKDRIFTILKLTGLFMLFLALPLGLIIIKIMSYSELYDTHVINFQLIHFIKIPTIFTLFLPFCLLLFPSWMYLIKPNSVLSFNAITPFNSSNQKNSELEKVIHLNEAEILIDYLHVKKPYLNTEFSLHQITKDLDIPQAKVIDIFKIHLKMSFPKYRNKLRVDYAIELIKNNDHLITTLHGISQKAGFRNKTTFNTAFKECMNCTPTEWIEKNNPLGS
jgi:AraC-like DNA-binding protein